MFFTKKVKKELLDVVSDLVYRVRNQLLGKIDEVCQFVNYNYVNIQDFDNLRNQYNSLNDSYNNQTVDFLTLQQDYEVQKLLVDKLVKDMEFLKKEYETQLTINQKIIENLTSLSEVQDEFEKGYTLLNKTVEDSNQLALTAYEAVKDYIEVEIIKSNYIN